MQFSRVDAPILWNEGGAHSESIGGKLVPVADRSLVHCMRHEQQRELLQKKNHDCRPNRWREPHWVCRWSPKGARCIGGGEGEGLWYSYGKRHMHFTLLPLEPKRLVRSKRARHCSTRERRGNIMESVKLSSMQKTTDPNQTILRFWHRVMQY